MDKEKHRLIEIKILSTKDEPDFNIQKAEENKSVACDSAVVIAFLKDDDILKTYLSSIDGEALHRMPPEKLYQAWITFTEHLAREESLDANYRNFLIHVCQLLRLKTSGLLNFPTPDSTPAS